MRVVASFEFSGMPDYWGGNGRRWDNDAGCVFAYYDGRTTLRGIIDQAVDDFWSGGDFEGCNEWDDVSTDDVRAALLDCLSDSGLIDYHSGEVAECAAEYAAVNGFYVCRECGALVGNPHKADCALLAEMAENGDIDDNYETEVSVEEEDCEPDYEYTDSPVCIFLLELVE